MINKYVLFLFVTFCKQCLCRRPIIIRPPYSGNSGSTEGAIAAGFVLLPILGGWIFFGITHVFAKKSKVESWAESLKIPRFYPNNLVIYVIWTLLYGAMGYAAYMVFRDCDGFTKTAALPLSLYGIQLALNWLWLPFHCAFRSLKLGFIHFILLDIAVVACTSSFFYVNKYTMYCMGPYLAILGYMTVMVYIYWKINQENTYKK